MSTENGYSKTVRDWDNFSVRSYKGIGEYDTPIVHASDYDAENWIGFNYATGCDDPEVHGVHFFIDDYQFQRVWKKPTLYGQMLKKFEAVCTPDFSMFTDYPRALSIWNHYRRHWLGVYWGEMGVRIVPTISWIDKDSYTWCFDGDPVRSTVAVSSVGIMSDPEALAGFMDGYNEMLYRLDPTKIIFYGKVPEGCEGPIKRVASFQEKWRKKDA